MDAPRLARTCPEALGKLARVRTARSSFGTWNISHTPISSGLVPRQERLSKQKNLLFDTREVQTRKLEGIIPKPLARTLVAGGREVKLAEH